jgi:hypothetical protein
MLKKVTRILFDRFWRILIVIVQISVRIRVKGFQVPLVECALGSLKHILCPLVQLARVQFVNYGRAGFRSFIKNKENWL